MAALTLIICAASSGPILHRSVPSARIPKSLRARSFAFERNVGQTDPGVRFLARGPAYSLFLTANDAVFQASNAEGHAVITMTLRNANSNPETIGVEQLSSKTNYFVGRDPARWIADVPVFGAVRYRSVYPDIDLMYYAHDGQLEHDFIVGTRGDPRRIALTFQGAGRGRVDGAGNVVLQPISAGPAFTLRRPIAYQDFENVKTEVACRYVLVGDDTVTFDVGAHDRSRPLTIDPVLAYSTYLGGSGDDQGLGIAVDGAGSIYVTGVTASVNFPTSNVPFSHLSGSTDAFVVKLNASGTQLLFSTYIGGSMNDAARGIAVDANGSAYIVGETASTDFPTASPIQSAYGGGSLDGFVAKLSPDGSTLVYSTYLGGSGTDVARVVQVDSADAVYVAGRTTSLNFPLVNPVQSNHGGGGFDAFVTKINSTGTSLSYSTYVGGSGDDGAYAISVDSAGNAYVAGYGSSTNFPVVAPYQPTNAGVYDALMWKLNPSGSMVYATYLGGSANDWALGIATDSSGNAYVTGFTSSSNFPTSSPLQPMSGGGGDVFVTKLDPTGSSLIYSTYLGGTGSDQGFGIAVDPTGSAYVTGRTGSPNFPLHHPIQWAYGGGDFDAFVAKITSSGTALAFSTYLGGSGTDSSGNFGGSNFGGGVVVTGAGEAYVTGFTTSDNFPTASAYQSHLGGGSDAFVAKLIPPQPFTDDVLIAGSTIVRSVHIRELRDRINALRVRLGLAPFAWTDPVLDGMSVKAVHLVELRSALRGAYVAAGLTPPSYTDPDLTPHETVIKAVHVAELRAALGALE